MEDFIEEYKLTWLMRIIVWVIALVMTGAFIILFCGFTYAIVTSILSQMGIL